MKIGLPTASAEERKALETSIEFSVRRSAAGLDPPLYLIGMLSDLETLFDAVSKASTSALLLDFDGTLAPFRIDPSSVRPWAGVSDLLDKIQETGRTRLSIVSGRPAKDIALRLNTRELPEIWGLHGAERRFPDGTIEQQLPLAGERAVLDEARSEILKANLGFRMEEKPNAIGLHWRGMASSGKDTKSLHRAKGRAMEVLEPYGHLAGLRLLQFDGGLELRAGRNKGDAVRLILKELSPASPVAYLGDDATDEDAFSALEGRGLGILVRRKWRPSAAQVWLRPPVQLRRFLRDWLAASAG
jgi:trehalose-phosphatase